MAKNDAKQKVIDALNKARGDELAAVLQYMSQHYALADADYGVVAAPVKLIAIDEMRHAEMLAERIFELGGIPVSEAGQKARKSQSIDEAMDYDMGLEEKAIEDYNEFAGVCIEARDSISAKLMEQIMAEEQIHLNYFQNIDRHIRELGPAYMAQITGGAPEAAGGPARGFAARQKGGGAQP
ncbi:MAG: bacterioferritin [Elusimicrobia bacterium]|nr:bacterioferritin [Elusimicrobiota bacterium]